MNFIDKLDISEIIDIFTCEDIISSHVRISYRFYQFVTTRYTTDFYIIKMITIFRHLSPGQTIATFSATYPSIVGRNMLRYVVLACCDRLAGALNLRGNTQVLLNETVALNSPLQFIKVDLFLHAVQLFSI